MPPIGAVLLTWRFDPVAAAVLLAGVTLHLVAVVRARRRGVRWARRRIVAFLLLGAGSYAVVSFGFLGATSAGLRWSFTLRTVLLLLVVPALAALGRPAALLRTASNHPERVDRLLTSRVFRLFGNAVVAPLVPLVLFLLFLTPIAGALRTTPVGEAAITVLVPLIGLLLAVALLEETGSRSGTFFVAEFLLGFVLLIADALPGILLRLAAGVVDGVHGQALQAAWVPSPLRDQQLAGDLLWFFAEVGDLPALILLIARWSRSDRREARSFDDLSDEEYTALVTAHLHGPDRPR